MSDDMPVGELVDEAQVAGTTAYVDSNGQVWRIKYLGCIDASQWVTR